MRETDYAYAVARVRALEHQLLSPAEMERLLQARDAGEVRRLLAAKGWPDDPGLRAWQVLKESAPERHVFDCLVVSNDFFNLKAALKALFSGREAQNYFMRPSLFPPETIAQAVAKKEFALLPPWLRGAARQGFDALARLNSGQLCDMRLDRAALEEALALAQKSGVPELVSLARGRLFSAAAKIALRAAMFQKPVEMTLTALPECPPMDPWRLAVCAQKSRAELAAYLRALGFAGAQALEEGDVALERWCDEMPFDLLGAKARGAFGPWPLAAYYVAWQNQERNVRVLLAAKQNAVAFDELKQEMRRI
jgi:V/A-type H+-transporting ATPase subunit C